MKQQIIDAGDAFDNLLNDILNFFITPAFGDSGHSDFTDAAGWVRRRADPLVLDLDGDGVELVPENGAAGAVFDHDGDGIATAMQWVGSDDGFVVFDRNVDGIINNGSELLGDKTPISTGIAADGFVALADFDSNLDGKVDASDANYSQLQVWRDLNQDGISQSNELMGLEAAGVVALNTTATPATGSDPSIGATGSYTKADGSTGAMADVLLLEGTVTETAVPVPPSAAAAALPTLDGMGVVRDLSEAVTLDSSGLLQTQLTQYANATTRNEQQGLLDQLLYTWAKSSVHAATPGSHSEPGLSVFVTYAFPQSADGSGGKSYQEWQQQIAVLELFNSQLMFDYFSVVNAARTYANMSGVVAWAGSWSTGWTMSLNGNTHEGWLGINFGLSQAQTDLLNQSYDELREYAYVGLLFQTRLKSYIDAIGLSLENGEFSLNFTQMQTMLADHVAADPVNGIGDVVDMVRYAGADLTAGGWDGYQFLHDQLRGVTLDDAMLQTLAEMNVQMGGVEAEVFAGGNTAGTIKSDILLGGGGNDTLSGGEQNDILFGEEGDDTLRGGNGNDALDGGAGNDSLNGDRGNDIYLFGPGSGQDTINNSTSSTDLGDTDVIRVAGNVKPADVELGRAGADLIVYLPATGDKLTVRNYFTGSEINPNYVVEQIQFADGTIWGIEQIKLISLLGTSLNDSLNGTVGSDVIEGRGGNDNLTGGDGNDTIRGGDGVDTLNGNNGNDVLDGGAGNDSMYGGASDDVYVFGRGYGQDLLLDNEVTAGGTNIIRFTADVNPADVRATQVGANLVLTITGTPDTLTTVCHERRALMFRAMRCCM